MRCAKRIYCLFVDALLLSFCMVITSSCRQPYQVKEVTRHPEPIVIQGPLVSSIHGEPWLRVRIDGDINKATIHCDGSLWLGPATQDQQVHKDARLFISPVTITTETANRARQNIHTGGFILIDGNGDALRWALKQIQIQPPGRAQALAYGNNLFPGKLICTPSQAAGNLATDVSRFDLVNHVPLESYLPGVLEHELYASWDAASYRAQAIAARSYALFERGLHSHRAYDIESTVASQVYGGLASRAKAIEAVRLTRGQVLVYNDRVLPAYYSSCSGGIGQDAAKVFPGVVDILPLQGDPHGRWGSKSKNYHWEPFTRDKNSLIRHLAAWGRANNHPIGSISSIKSIDITGRNRAGRPTEFTVTDEAGREFSLSAEWFRFACNYDDTGLPDVASNKRLKSSFVQIRVVGDLVQFYNGRGMGHGVGLCQWGMQEMSQAGYSEESILTFYYRGASIKRIY